MNNITNLNALTAKLALKDNLSENDARTFVIEFFRTIEKGLKADGETVVKGLGRFAVRNGQVIFTPDEDMKRTVNDPFEMFSPVEVGDDYRDDEPQPEDELIPATEAPQPAAVETPKAEMEDVNTVISEERNREEELTLGPDAGSEETDDTEAYATVTVPTVEEPLAETASASPVVGDVADVVRETVITEEETVVARPVAEIPKPPVTAEERQPEVEKESTPKRPGPPPFRPFNSQPPAPPAEPVVPIYEPVSEPTIVEPGPPAFEPEVSDSLYPETTEETDSVNYSYPKQYSKGTVIIWALAALILGIIIGVICGYLAQPKIDDILRDSGYTKITSIHDLRNLDDFKE